MSSTKQPTDYIQSITIATSAGPQQTQAAVFGPFAVTLNGVTYWEYPITNAHHNHYLVFNVTHIATGYSVLADLTDTQAVAVAQALAADPLLCAVFDATEAATIVQRMTDTTLDHFNHTLADALEAA